MVVCLERDADLHMAQLMPLPLTVSCFSKVQTGFTFLVPAHPGSPGQRAVKRVCVYSKITRIPINAGCLYNLNDVIQSHECTPPRHRHNKTVCMCPDNSRLSPTETVKSEHVNSYRPTDTATPDATQTGLFCRVWPVMRILRYLLRLTCNSNACSQHMN